MLRHLGVVNGQDRGRIYRVLPEGKRPGRRADLGKLSTAELTRLLAHPNGWHRETAARVLHERHDPDAVPHLLDLAVRAPAALGRTQARHALAAEAAYTPELALAALTETDENALVHGLRLAEKFAPGSPPIRDRIAALTAHAAAPVRYQALFSLGGIAHPEKAALIARALRQEGTDRRPAG
jgi:HEAT repeat protein